MTTKRKKQPSTKGANGRDAQGRFITGWTGGPGNPFSAQVNKLRSVLIGSVTQKDMKLVVAALIGKAKDGDTTAIKILLDRVFGPPISADLLSRIEELERTIKKG